MSLEAQADREKNARMTVASAEADMADMLAEAASAYGDPYQRRCACAPCFSNTKR